MEKRKKIYITHDAKRWQLVGVKAMLVPVDGMDKTIGKMIWADVKLDVLMLQAALDTRKMERKKRKY